jgi:hypothetical protein
MYCVVTTILDKQGRFSPWQFSFSAGDFKLVSRDHCVGCFNMQGPAAIIRVCRAIVGNLYEQKYVAQKVRQKYLSLLQSIEQFIKSIAHEKVVTLAGLRSRLAAASGDGHFGKALSDAGLGTIVLWLSIQVN